MIDALLLATRDTCWEAGFGWDSQSMQIMGDNKPAPGMGDWFCSIHQLAEGQANVIMNAADDYFSFGMTITRRVNAKDRVGTAFLSNRNARTLAIETGLNARANQLKEFVRMNWWILGRANDLLAEMYPQSVTVYAFAEPMHWESTEEPKFVGGEWFEAEANQRDCGLVVALRFRNARRLQAIATYT